MYAVVICDLACVYLTRVCQTILEEITNADSGAPCSPQHRGKVRHVR